MVVTAIRLGALWVVILGLSGWSMNAGPVSAGEAPVVIDGIPQPITLDERIVEFNLLPYWRKVMREALAGNCTPVLTGIAAAKDGDGVGYIYAKAELLDHGLCIPFDPVAAYIEIQRLEPYFPGTVALWRGWKSHYGHGLAKAGPDAVKQDFLRYLLSITWRSFDRAVPTPEQTAINVDRQVAFDLGARPVPPVLANGADWLKDQLSDRQKRLELARVMLWGGGTYNDGTPLPEALSGRDADMFISNLAFLHAEAALMKAEALMQGLLPHYKPENGELPPLIRRAADCLDRKAILYMIEANQTGRLPGGHVIDKSKTFAQRYTMLAEALGIPRTEIDKALHGDAIERPSYIKEDVEYIQSGKACRLS